MKIKPCCIILLWSSLGWAKSAEVEGDLTSLPLICVCGQEWHLVYDLEDEEFQFLGGDCIPEGLKRILAQEATVTLYRWGPPASPKDVLLNCGKTLDSLVDEGATFVCLTFQHAKAWSEHPSRETVWEHGREPRPLCRIEVRDGAPIWHVDLDDEDVHQEEDIETKRREALEDVERLHYYQYLILQRDIESWSSYEIGAEE